MTEDRAVLKAADKEAMPEGDFAYVDSKGDKHFPIGDAVHAEKAVQLFGTFEGWESNDDKVAAAHKIVAAAKKFGVGVHEDSPVGKAAGVTNDIEAKSAARKPRVRRELDVQPEFRVFNTAGELRAKKDEESGLIAVEGRVIVFGVPYEVNDQWGSFTETIHRGACTELLTRDDLDIRFLFNHGGMPLARTGADASLTATESDGGLDIRAMIDPRMSLASDLQVAMERGIITQMSVGMEVSRDKEKDDVWTGADDFGMPNIRNIYRLENVFDASAVTFPASPTTSIALARSAWAGMPVESRERTRKLWTIARDIRSGRSVSQAEADTLMHALERMHSVDENSEERESERDEFRTDEVAPEELAEQTWEDDGGRPAPEVEVAPEVEEVEAEEAEAEAEEAKAQEAAAIKRAARLRMIDADLALVRMRRPQR